MNDALIYKKRLEGIASLIFLLSCIVFRVRIGNIGMGYMLTCFMMYEVMWVIFGERISDVLGRLIRSRLSKNKFRTAGLIWRYGLSMNFFTGLFGSVLIGALGSFLVKSVFRIEHSLWIVWIFALLFGLRLMTETVSGYLSSRKNTIVFSGISSIIRQIALMVFGNICISLIAGYGEKVSALLKQDDISAVYACLGIGISAVISELLTLVFVLFLKLAPRQKDTDYDDDVFHRRDNTGNVFLMIWKSRIFETLSGLFTIVPYVIAVFVFYKKTEDPYVCVENLGLMGMTVLIPSLLFCFFGYSMLLSLVSEISSNLRHNQMRYARNIFQTGFHLCFIYGSFGCIYMIAQSALLSKLFGESNVEATGRLLILGSFITLTMLASFFVMRLLIQGGLIYLTYLVQIPADIIFLISFFIITSRGRELTLSFAIALLIHYVCKFVGYLILALVKLDMSIDPISNVFVPVLVAAVVCILNVFISKMISPHLGTVFTLIISFLEMAVLYLVILLLGRNFKDTELKYLPAGRFVTMLGQTLHVL